MEAGAGGASPELGGQSTSRFEVHPYRRDERKRLYCCHDSFRPEPGGFQGWAVYIAASRLIQGKNTHKRGDDLRGSGVQSGNTDQATYRGAERRWR